MAGCFGNHPYDRYLENEVDAWLESQEESDVDKITKMYYWECEACEDSFTPDEAKDNLKCPECGDKLKESKEEVYD